MGRTTHNSELFVLLGYGLQPAEAEVGSRMKSGLGSSDPALPSMTRNGRSDRSGKGCFGAFQGIELGR